MLPEQESASKSAEAGELGAHADPKVGQVEVGADVVEGGHC